MSGGATQPSEAAPMVTASAGPSEGSLLRELVGDRLFFLFYHTRMKPI